MGDPLSALSSIAGLIQLAGQIYGTLDTFIRNVRDAPNLARNIRTEITGFRDALCAYQKLFAAGLRPERASMIPADLVVISLTDAVLFLSELDTTVSQLSRSTSEFGVVDRLLWAHKKPKLNEYVSRLQWHKLTLVLQLNVLQCQSDQEAQRNRQRHAQLVTDKITQDKDLERRLELVERRLRVTKHDTSMDTHSVRTRFSDGSDRTIRSSSDTRFSHYAQQQPPDCHDFEEHLQSSWVYRRAQGRDENMSFRTSVFRVSVWSALSDYSLANISILSVVALPIEKQEMSETCWRQSKRDSSGVFNEERMPVTPTTAPPPSIWPKQPDSPMDNEVLTTILEIAGSTYDDDLDTPSTMGMSSLTEDSAICLDDDESLPEPAVEDEVDPADDTTLIRRRSWLSVVDDPADEEEQVINDTLAAAVYKDDSLKPCLECGNKIQSGRALTFAGSFWHFSCFRCTECRTHLDPDGTILLRGNESLICSSCMWTCLICGDRPSDEVVTIGSDIFCRGCFLCRHCKRAIQGSHFVQTKAGHYTCTTCHEEREARIDRRRQREKKKEKEITAWSSTLSLSPTLEEGRLNQPLPPLPPSKQLDEDEEQVVTDLVNFFKQGPPPTSNSNSSGGVGGGGVGTSLPFRSGARHVETPTATIAQRRHRKPAPVALSSPSTSTSTSSKAQLSTTSKSPMAPATPTRLYFTDVASSSPQTPRTPETPPPNISTLRPARETSNNESIATRRRRANKRDGIIMAPLYHTPPAREIDAKSPVPPRAPTRLVFDNVDERPTYRDGIYMEEGNLAFDEGA